MAEKLRVRVYNVRFGDAVLITVPDSDGNTTTTRHILIDVGNVLNDEGGDDAVFKPVLANIIQELNGSPVDLYVMTHEHLDHAQGLFYAASKVYPPGQLKQTLNVQNAWLTGSAEPNYYETHPEAKKQKKLYEEAFRRIQLYADKMKLAESRALRIFLANNDPRSTGQCVDFLRNLAANTFYVHRQISLNGKHNFKEATFKIWAPEEDTSSYYKKKLLPLSLLDDGDSEAGIRMDARPEPPAGVDAGAFYDLLTIRETGIPDTLLAIDKAANNTSVVFSMKWRGWTLLFAGDAEIGSWRMMEKQGVFEPIDFIKVSHHGSHNGTPEDDVLDKFFPKIAGKKKRAVISTWTDTYSGIPHTPTNNKLKSRAKLTSILDKKDKPYLDFFFKEGGP